jgi:hypothetical protein
MKKTTSIVWGRWLRGPKPEHCRVDEIRSLSRHVKVWAVAAILIVALLALAAILVNYFAGIKAAANIDASTRQMLKLNEESVRRALNAMYPNDFVFKPFEDSQWYVPTPVGEYVRLNILSIPGGQLSLYLTIKNNSDYPARNVYGTISFSNQEFVETGEDIVTQLTGHAGLNVYPVSAADSYLSQAAAFEWLHIAPKSEKKTARIDLTLRGNSGRLTVKINAINRLAFEFRRQVSE